MSLLSWLRSRNYPEDLHLNPHQVCRGITKESSSVFAYPPATPHRPDAAELLLPTRPGGACQTENCDGTATRIVARSLRHKEVCSKCSDELVAVFGWELVGRI